MEQLRKMRRKQVKVLHTKISELELVENIKTIILIIRNLSFVKGNEHAIMKCKTLVDIIMSLFIDYHDKEITFNCLDIITSLARHITLTDILFGKQLVLALFNCLRSTS